MADLRWDRKFALEQAGEEEEILAELLDLLRQTSATDLEKIEAGLKARDAEAVGDAAHSIKGASASLGVEGLRQVAYEIEKAGRSTDLAAAEAGCVTLREMVAQLGQLQ